MCVKSLIESGESGSGFMYLPEYFKGIVSLLLNSTSSESDCSSLELYDSFEELEGVGDKGRDCTCDKGDGSGL